MLAFHNVFNVKLVPAMIFILLPQKTVVESEGPPKFASKEEEPRESCPLRFDSKDPSESNVNHRAYPSNMNHGAIKRAIYSRA